MPKFKVVVIGAGLAGSECSHFLLNRGIDVVLVEIKGKKRNPSQKLETFSELVCTNSLKSNLPTSAHGILKEEMKSFDSIIIKTAYNTRVPAGAALAVDRDRFSKEITDTLLSYKNLTLIEEEAVNPLELKERFNANMVVVASGPLTNAPLEKWIKENILADDLYFYDSIAPVVDGSTLDYSKLYFKDRYSDSEKADYLNAPLSKEEYYSLVEELINAKKLPSRDFEDYKFFEGCLPVDLMAQRGKDTLAFSCMKPVGLELPTGERPYAVVQLRKENLLGDAYNLVGFQNRLTYGEQTRIFRMIPGLKDAEFFKLGSVHRNTFLNSSVVLNSDLSSKKFSDIYFSGQLVGVEGYTESAAMGLYVGIQIERRLNGKDVLSFPSETAIGALVNYIMTAKMPSPSNINFGLFPDVDLKIRGKRKDKRKMKHELIAKRATEFLSKMEL